MESGCGTEAFFITLSLATALHVTATLSFVIPSRERHDKACALLHYRRVKPKGAPGLAFETWDPSNQFLLETPTVLFVIPRDLQFRGPVLETGLQSEN